MTSFTDRSLANGVIWPGFLGTRAPDWLRRELADGLAGVVYFGQNIDPDDPDGTGRLSAALTAEFGPLVIGSDEEGGTVTRLQARQGSALPSAHQLGRLDDVAATEQVGREIGRQSARAGITLVLGPVADVNTNPANPIIGVRAFGADPELVGRHVAATVRGLHDAGVAACAKHYPGHGDTAVDSHTGLPRVELTREDVVRDHLPPFAAAVAAGVDALMTSHVVFPWLGEDPVTVNGRALAAVREDLGFDGVIVTDAVDMAAIRRTYGAGEGAVRALEAGADLVCTGNPSTLGPKRGAVDDVTDFFEVRTAITEAIAAGRLSPERLERSAQRVRSSIRAPRTMSPAPLVDGTALARAVIRVRGDVSGRIARVLDIRPRSSIAEATGVDPWARGLPVTVEPIDPARSDLVTAAAARGGVALLADRTSDGSAQRRAIEDARAIDPEVAVIDVGLPARTLAAPVVEVGGGGRAAATALAELGARWWA